VVTRRRISAKWCDSPSPYDLMNGQCFQFIIEVPPLRRYQRSSRPGALPFTYPNHRNYTVIDGHRERVSPWRSGQDLHAQPTHNCRKKAGEQRGSSTRRSTAGRRSSACSSSPETPGLSGRARPVVVKARANPELGPLAIDAADFSPKRLSTPAFDPARFPDEPPACDRTS